jgi:pyruvate,water dikinase
MQWVAKLADFGRTDVAHAGGKAANLGELVRAGLPVPEGFVVTTGAYRHFVEQNDLGSRILSAAREASGEEQARMAARRISELFRSQGVDPDLRAEIVGAYERLGGPAVAVRSSATAEDLAEASFAGQQDSYLNVQGPAALLAAVVDCWASLWTSRALAYRQRQGIEPEGVSLAVVVQTLVAADASGVLFTANPANGRRGEAVISGAWGLGEAIVGGLVDTDQVVVDKESGRLVTRHTAEKSIMTVRTAAGTEERPVPIPMRSQPVLDDPTAQHLVELGSRIEKLFGVPQDIEWARTGSALFVLQSRAITALPPAEAAPPTTWVLPEPQSLYFRASIVEQLPDPLSPLFAELIDGSVTRSVDAVIAELLGGSVLRDGDVGMPTINGYAYYAYTRSGLLRLTINSPRGLRLLWGGGRLNAQVRWRTYSHPRYAETVRAWRQRDAGSLSAVELLAGARELLDAGTEYYTSVQTIIPIAVTNEVVFARFYDLMVRRPGDPAATIFLLGYDSVPILAEKSLFDLARWAQQQPNVREWLQDTAVDQIVARLDELSDDDGSELGQLARRFAEHLEQYGHTVYNLDFVNAVPADDPAPLVDTLKLYLRGEGSDPYERQRRTVQRREDATVKISSRLDPVRKAAFGRLLQQAQSVAPLREDALADVGLAWPTLRRLVLELGRRLQTSHRLHRPDDVFWCTTAEIAAHLPEPVDGPTGDLAEAVERRKEIWRGQRRVTPPQMLPQTSWLHLLDKMMPASATEQAGDVLQGIGASGGRITAVARILRGPEDFAGLGVGEVLVASITTPAWTPLFARAAAVVTDIGGPLSHSSIVAREYGIPAVLGTGVATRRIEHGQRITVDGDRGRVWLGPDSPDQVEQTVPTGADRRRRLVMALVLGVGGSLVVRSFIRRHLRPRGRSAAPSRQSRRDTPPKAQLK